MMKRGYDGVSAAHMRMRVGGLQPMIAEGDMRLDPDDQAMDMTIESPQLGGKARLILVDDVVYFGLPDLPKGMFVAADPNDPDDRFGQIAAGLLEQVSVEQSYLAFGQALRRVVYLGPDAVAGTPADRYRMVIDAKQALRAQGQPVPPGMPAIFSSDMWLDGQGRGVRVSTDVGGIVVLTTMSDWNEPISIQAPPRGKIVQLP
jgi:hypothetical protein